jgi:hypothetical protein
MRTVLMILWQLTWIDAMEVLPQISMLELLTQRSVPPHNAQQITFGLTLRQYPFNFRPTLPTPITPSSQGLQKLGNDTQTSDAGLKDKYSSAQHKHSEHESWRLYWMLCYVWKNCEIGFLLPLYMVLFNKGL